jgi:hypothetical protein
LLDNLTALFGRTHACSLRPVEIGIDAAHVDRAGVAGVARAGPLGNAAVADVSAVVYASAAIKVTRLDPHRRRRGGAFDLLRAFRLTLFARFRACFGTLGASRFAIVG